MASEKPPPSGNQGRRRPPTVINLEATEVASGPSTDEPPAEPMQREESVISPSPEPVVQTGAAEGPASPPPPDPPSGRRSFGGWRPHVSAAIAGVAGALVILLVLWLTGVLSDGRDQSTDLAPRLSAIERQWQDLAARPAPPSIDPKTIDDLAARIGKIEGAQAAPRPLVTDPVVLSRLTAAEQGAKSLADNVAALARRSDSSEAVLRDIQGRLERMSVALGEIRTMAQSAAAGSDRAARLALATAALRAAVERGDPFVAELAVVRQLASDASAASALEPFAARGVPSDAALSAELATLIKPLLNSDKEPRGRATFLERLQANAEHLVRVRPVGDTPGDDRAAILARIEQRVAQANVPGALAELAKLPPDARASLEPWIAKAEARRKAIEASQRLAAEAMAALKTSP